MLNKTFVSDIRTHEKRETEVRIVIDITKVDFNNLNIVSILGKDTSVTHIKEQT